jgi:hypothetical protein
MKANKATSNNALVVSDPQAEAVAPAALFLPEDFGMGMEDVTSKDKLIPRLTILQALSPQLSRTKPEFIDGARAGQFCDISLNRVSDVANLIACFYQTQYVEWAPRSSNGGMIKNHGADMSVIRGLVRDGARYLRNANDPKNSAYIQETATWFCLRMLDGEDRFQPCFISMTGTRLKTSRRWMTAISNEVVTYQNEMKPAPIFWRIWRATTVVRSNAEGEWFDWSFNPSITTAEFGKNTYPLAREFCAEAKREATQLAHANEGERSSVEAEDEGAM